MLHCVKPETIITLPASGEAEAIEAEASFRLAPVPNSKDWLIIIVRHNARVYAVLTYRWPPPTDPDKVSVNNEVAFPDRAGARVRNVNHHRTRAVDGREQSCEGGRAVTSVRDGAAVFG